MQPDDEPTADVEIVASAAADQLRFHVQPEFRVSFPGTGARDSRQITARRKIDTPVQPGKTYQGVFVTMRISSRLVDTSGCSARPPCSPDPLWTVR
jgi:hypothetical protein